MQTTPKDDFQNMPFALIEHIVEPNSQPIPVVSDLLVESIILTNHENKVIYSNPAGYHFISELSGLENFDNVALDKILPFYRRSMIKATMSFSLKLRLIVNPLL